MGASERIHIEGVVPFDLIDGKEKVADTDTDIRETLKALSKTEEATPEPKDVTE